jgi:hypothetical protein
MITAFQASIGAYMAEDGELLCEDCFASGDRFARPVSNYELDEEQAYASEGAFDWDYAEGKRTVDGKAFARIDGLWHAEACGCEAALLDINGHELREPYTDTDCAREQYEDES